MISCILLSGAVFMTAGTMQSTAISMSDISAVELDRGIVRNELIVHLSGGQRFSFSLSKDMEQKSAIEVLQSCEDEARHVGD